MLKSMTGYGRTEEAAGDKTFLVEIKSLNGKQFELNLKLTPLLKPYEFAIRNALSEKLQRGTIDCTISLKQNGGSGAITINKEMAKAYFQPLSEVAAELNLGLSEYILAAMLRLPDVVVPNTEVLSEEQYGQFQQSLQNAINAINKHRLLEGSALEKDLIERINNILAYQEKISELEPLRQHKMKDELRRKMEEQVGKENYDANRLEQEMIYYIEKIDISEEQVRLRNHCDYFLNILKEGDDSKGKKLGFVLQEIGREINTTGAKAYDAGIQKLVVLMKDELEKAKEQVLNVL
ncbi:YicC family protein [Lacibacter luteus]|uniref:YicC family protein n=1 Tax=Lacibacter luteus TaxID=2508719 RepID=A0A4Q1CIG3_9BACT|nr:YicC/YloC family endoribonuclease [Lacibacter luteus]RXK60391.1 YicC family protein [Lacibacter luteus]